MGDWVKFDIEDMQFKGIISRVDGVNGYLCYSQDAANKLFGHGTAKESTNGYGSWHCPKEKVTKINRSPIGQIKVVGYEV